MGLGEVAPGGAGSGLYGILVLAIVTVFVAGLMVGRTPEYLRKKITGREIKLVSLYILTMPVLVLAGTGLAMALSTARRSRSSTPARTGLSEVLYAFMSAANNNGSAFAGLSVNTDFYNTALGLVMLAGRLPADRPGARAGRLAGPPAAGPGDRRHAAHPPAAVRRDARRRRHHRRRPDLLPRARARPAGGGPDVDDHHRPTAPHLAEGPPHVGSTPPAGSRRPARPQDAADLAAGRASASSTRG